MKGSAVVEAMVPVTLGVYAQFCGETLARAHARSGDPIAIAAYLGKKDRFDQSITDFSERYADQNEQRLRRRSPRRSDPAGSKPSKASDPPRSVGVIEALRLYRVSGGGSMYTAPQHRGRVVRTAR